MAQPHHLLARSRVQLLHVFSCPSCKDGDASKTRFRSHTTTCGARCKLGSENVPTAAIKKTASTIPRANDLIVPSSFKKFEPKRATPSRALMSRRTICLHTYLSRPPPLEATELLTTRDIARLEGSAMQIIARTTEFRFEPYCDKRRKSLRARTSMFCAASQTSMASRTARRAASAGPPTGFRDLVPEVVVVVVVVVVLEIFFCSTLASLFTSHRHPNLLSLLRYSGQLPGSNFFREHPSRRRRDPELSDIAEELRGRATLTQNTHAEHPASESHASSAL